MVEATSAPQAVEADRHSAVDLWATAGPQTSLQTTPTLEDRQAADLPARRPQADPQAHHPLVDPLLAEHQWPGAEWGAPVGRRAVPRWVAPQEVDQVAQDRREARLWEGETGDS